MKPFNTSLKLNVDFQIDPLWCAWFSGLVDGEGCFYVGNNLSRTRCLFKITLREDEKKVLDDIKKTLRCGNSTPMSNAKSRLTGGLARDGLQFRISAHNELLYIIVPLLDEYPLHTKKLSVYLKWREAVLLVSERKYSALGIIKEQIALEGKTRLQKMDRND